MTGNLFQSSGAILSAGGLYRYALWRSWGSNLANVIAFILLNPSIADTLINDPTVRRCIGFAKRLGFDGLLMLNLFALRSTDPKNPYSHHNPIGDANDDALQLLTKDVSLVVAAWGTHGAFLHRDAAVSSLLPEMLCLGKTKAGHPRHPLYLKTDTELEPFNCTT